MRPTQHVITVTATADGTVTVDPHTLTVHKGDFVSWQETSEKPLKLTFSAEDIFKRHEFALEAAVGTGLIAHKAGRHEYKIEALDSEHTVASPNAAPPVIVIMDPTSPNAQPGKTA